MTDPKPPAASGDHAALARRIVGIVLYNEDREAQVYGILRAAAKEAQLRVLDEYRGLMLGQRDCQRVNDAAMLAASWALSGLRAKVEKEGPL